MTRALAGAIAVGLSAVFASSAAAQRQVPTYPFDAAYMVAASGSTDPVTHFALDGPKPWLYLELPDSANYAYIVSGVTSWFAPGAGTPRFRWEYGGWAGYSPTALDKYWFTPSDADWAAAQAVGTWRIDSNFSLVDLVIIYGGGAPVEYGRGSSSVSFSVVDAMAGDFDHNLAVDGGDMLMWQRSLAGGMTPSDLGAWQTTFGAGTSAAGASVATVPEPHGALLAAGAVVLVGLRRRLAPRAA